MIASGTYNEDIMIPSAAANNQRIYLVGVGTVIIANPTDLMDTKTFMWNLTSVNTAPAGSTPAALSFTSFDPPPARLPLQRYPDD